MNMQRRVKLVPVADGQSVIIPREFALPGSEAVIRSEGGRIVIEAPPDEKTQAFLAWLAALEPIDYAFEIAELPADPVPDLG